jgi:hypothetical protein
VPADSKNIWGRKGFNQAFFLNLWFFFKNCCGVIVSIILIENLILDIVPDWQFTTGPILSTIEYFLWWKMITDVFFWNGSVLVINIR